jgi:hypothetical protein
MIMKRIGYFWMIAALFMVTTVNAQVRFGVKGGVNINHAAFNKDVYKLDNVTGFHLGPVIEGMFGQGGVGMDAAILFVQKGIKVEPHTVKNNFLEIPVNLKFKFGMPIINPYVAAGPYASFRISGGEKWDMKENASGIVEQMKTQSFGDGLNFTAGAEFFDRLQIGLTYGWSLTDNYKTFDANVLDSYKGKLHTWQVGLAFFF